MSEPSKLPTVDRTVMAGGGLTLGGLVVWLALQVSGLSSTVAAQGATLDAMQRQLVRIETQLDKGR